MLQTKYIGGSSPLAGDFCIAALCLEILAGENQELQRVLPDFPWLPEYLQPFEQFAVEQTTFSKAVQVTPPDVVEWHQENLLIQPEENTPEELVPLMYIECDMDDKQGIPFSIEPRSRLWDDGELQRVP